MNTQHSKSEKPANPLQSASRISKMTFWWLRDLYKIGMTRTITDEDVYQTLDHHESNRIAEKFTRIWNEELKSKNPSTLRLFYKAYGLKLLIIGLLFSICETVLRCAQPLLLGELLTNFSDENATKESSYLYATGIVLCSLLPVLTFHPFIYYAFEVAMKIRIGSSRLVYDKILRITKSAQEDGLHGKIINLLSNDLGKFDIAIAFLHDLWKGPFETILLGYLIYREVGISGVVGILFILSFIPIQSYIGRKAAHFRNQTTKRTDIRVRLMNEIINGIQVIKMYSWQENFAKIIEKIRRKEMKAVKGSSYILALLYTLWAVSRVSLFLTLLTYIYSGNVLSARKVFILTAYYNILNLSMVHFWPLAITFCAEGYISSKRLREFLLMPENKQKPLIVMQDKEKEMEVKKLKVEESLRVHHEIAVDESKAIVLKNATANWYNSDLDITTGLNSLNYEFKSGNKYALIGPVGSGKTSFLQAILGELEIDSGSIEIFGSLSYSNQEAFLFEGTIRNNIVFTEVYEEKRYSKVVAACGLLKDFEQLENGDQTFVGEKGVSLSGGQKARINLARAVYKEADIYLLDDPLSAVDSDVGSTIFYECVIKYLSNKTVILVTHQLQYLHNIEDILVISDGQIKASGSYEELKDKEIASILPVADSEGKEKDEDETFKEITKHINVKKEEEEEGDAYNEKETQEAGKVRIEVYKNYIKSVQNIPLVIFVLFLRVLNQSIASFIDYFVAQWVNWEESIASHSNSTVSINDTVISKGESDDIDQKRQQFINIYIGIICVFIFVILNAEFSFFYSLLRASINLHNSMFRGLVNTYLQFFNQNPSGRILNRFSKDIGSIDTQLPNCLFECICFILEFIAIMILVSLVNVYFTIPTIILTVLLIVFRHVYVNSSRNIKRVESISKSPIFAHTNATLQGLTTIRALKAENSVISNFNAYLDHNTSAWFMFWTTTRAFAFWLDMVCVIYIAVVTFTFIEMNQDDVPGGNVGLAITQIIGIIGMTQWGIRQTSELENQMVCVERVLEYANLPSEVEKLKPPPKNWPSRGEIEFDDLSLYYKNEECKAAINKVNLRIKPNEKIGIVGRTGSGKSSIIQALFRMTRIEGSIKIDGIDTKSIDLLELRKNISIIPQDPVLFSGSLRFNLDAFSENTDDAIWKVLELVELKETIKSLSGGLETKISDGGSNFSVGQRQLICLARALLRKNRILVLDEATANVDYETDKLIQKTISEEFADCTVLTIAHRLHTVINSDKILVMENGYLVEFDSPHILLKNENGYLRKLVNQTSVSLIEEAEMHFQLKQQNESLKKLN